MGFRFRKRIRLFKGLSINVGKGGITSVTARKGRITVTAGKRGIHETARIGEGLSYTTGSSSSNQGCLFFIAVMILITAVIVWMFALQILI